jgi:hypothetical protein
MSCRFEDRSTGPEQLVLSVINPLVNVGDTADVQAFYTIGGKPAAGAIVTFQLRDPKTNTPTGKTYTAVTGADGMARITLDTSDVALARRLTATTPSASGSGNVASATDVLSSPVVTWISQKLVIYPTPNARMPAGTAITVVGEYLGEFRVSSRIV